MKRMIMSMIISLLLVGCVNAQPTEKYAVIDRVSQEVVDLVENFEYVNSDTIVVEVTAPKGQVITSIYPRNLYKIVEVKELSGEW